MPHLTEAQIERACKLLQKILPTEEEAAELMEIAQQYQQEATDIARDCDEALEEIYLSPELMSREDQRLLDESDERAAFNDRLDMMRDQ